MSDAGPAPVHRALEAPRMMRDRSKHMPDAGIEHACDLRLPRARLCSGTPALMTAPGNRLRKAFRRQNGEYA
jgi:hypothetical protein